MLRAGCSRTPGRCPGALPRPRSCPFPTPRPPDTAPGCTTWMERGMGCASPAEPDPCPGGIPPITAGMEMARAGKSPRGLRAAAACSQLCSWIWPWPGVGSLRRQSKASGTAHGIIQNTQDRAVPTSGQHRRLWGKRQAEPRVPLKELLWGVGGVSIPRLLPEQPGAQGGMVVTSRSA